MRRKTGFTLVELLVVIAIITLLISILLPSLNRAREITKRVMCRQNLNNLGKAYAMYLNTNDDNFPWHYSFSTDWTLMDWWSRTGDVNKSSTNRILVKNGQLVFPPTTANGIHPFFCVTSLMYMLVREGQDPGLFICPSDDANPEPRPKDNEINQYYWDFSAPDNNSGNVQHVSYSIQSPMAGGPFKLTKQFLLADKNPNWDKSKTGVKALVPWADSMSDKAIYNNNSPNHQGEENEALRGDGSAASFKRADVNDLSPKTVSPRISNDCIYTTYSNNPTAANARASIETNPSKMGVGYAEDAFLIGPIK